MKKTNKLKKLLAIAALGVLSVFNASAQTSGSGALTNTCTPAANDGGVSTNTSIGCGAGKAGMSGGLTTILGNLAGNSLTTGSDNTLLGYKSGNALQGGYNNTYIGTNAGKSDVSGTTNTAIGWNALQANNDANANANTAVGAGSLKNNVYGAQNTAVGVDALFYSGQSSGYGFYNTAIGYNALHENTSGSYNAATGYYSGLNTTTGSYNSSFGNTAFSNNRTGSYNSCFGFHAGKGTGTGTPSFSYNSFFGYYAGDVLATGGDYNSGFGCYALQSLSTGTANVAFGYNAGQPLTTGNANTMLGYGASVSTGTLSNSASVGYNTVVTASNKIFFGDANTAGCYNAANVWAAQSDQRFKINVKEDVTGLSFINKLRPVTYNMDTKKLTEFITQNMTDTIRDRYLVNVDFKTSTNIIHAGFLAQEVETAAKDCGFTSSTIVLAPSNSSDPYALNYIEFVVPLVKAVQELSKKVDSLTNIIGGANGSRARNDAEGKVGNIINIELSNVDVIVLNEAAPNPFADQTIITYNIPKKANSAQILFYDQNGHLIKTVEITSKGAGQLNVYANDLTSGIYSYTLVVDGKVFSTKKLIKQ